MKQTVIIDIGHYKCDSGAIAKHGNTTYQEVDICKAICDKIKSEIGKEIDIKFTSGTLENRCKIENNTRCALFVSIHCNSYEDKSATGYETLIHAKGGRAEKLATKINKHMEKQKLGIPNRGVRVAKDYLGYDLFVLKNTHSPAVLLECAFITNPKDIKVLENSKNNITMAVCNAIREELEIKNSTQTPTPTKTLYRIVTNSYENKSNAELELKKLREQGHKNAFIHICKE